MIPKTNVLNQGEVVTLTDEKVNEIIEKAAERAVEKMTENFYAHVGRNIVNRFLIWVGIAVFSFLVGTGRIKLPGI